jgi:predicted signal transduction protein with EAL and GGDEF domain
VSGSARELPHGRCWASVSRRVAWAGLVVAMVAAVLLCLLIAGVQHVPVPPLALAVAALVFAAAQLARVPARVGGDVVRLAWGEVGLITAICVLPLVWVPVAVALGTVAGHGSRLRGVDRAWRGRVLCAMAGLIAGSVAATAVVGLLDPTVQLDKASDVPVRVDVAHPVTVLPLVAAAIAYFLVTSCLTAAWIATAAGSSTGFGATWFRLARAKRLILTGNVVAALAVAVLVSVDVRWSLLLVPILAALHWTYVHRLRVTAARGNWQALAQVTQDLHQIDEPTVARAALRGAVELFAPDDIELLLDWPTGPLRYVMPAGGGRIEERALNAWSPVSQTRTVTASHTVVRQLGVGGTRLGEIRLGFRRPGALTMAEQHAFSTFADAVGSALHDATASRQLRAMTAQSAFDAVHDPLTGLCNRSTLLARGDAHLRQAAPGPVVALVLIDIDGFRAVNETLGLAAGDELLRALAGRLAQACGPDELVGRLGADEFAILLTNPSGRRRSVGPLPTAAVAARAGGGDLPGRGWALPLDRARDLIGRLSAPVDVFGVTLAVEASAGVVVDAADGCDMSELLRRAGSALLLAKQEPGRVARYDERDDLAAASRLVMLTDFRDALASPDQLFVEILPTVDLVGGQVIGAEALIRWQHPYRGRLAAPDFVEAVAHTDLAVGLTHRVLDLALTVAAGWAREGIAAPISVNVFARCFDQSLPVWLAERLAHHGVAPGRLVLEITEAISADADTARAVMATLRASGVRICVDDFGTGSASLSFLTHFAVDEVKIDRSFVAAMLDSPEPAAIVRATVDLARDLGLCVVAEGVESAEQWAALLELGVTAAQGFLLHPPLAVPAATEILREPAGGVVARPRDEADAP